MPGPYCFRIDSGRILCAYAYVGHRAGRREGNPALPAHQGTGQTGRSVRRQVPHHRLRAEQFHQLRDLLDLRADAVPQPVAAAAPERRLAVRRAAEDRSSSFRCRRRCARPGETWYQGTADAIYQNINLVEQADPDVVAIFGARPHLPHEHHQHDRVPRAEERRGHGGRHPGGQAAWPPSSASSKPAGDGRILAFHEKNPDAPTMPGDPQPRLRLHGQLHFLHAHAAAAAARRRRR